MRSRPGWQPTLAGSVGPACGNAILEQLDAMCTWLPALAIASPEGRGETQLSGTLQGLAAQHALPAATIQKLQDCLLPKSARLVSQLLTTLTAAQVWHHV